MSAVLEVDAKNFERAWARISQKCITGFVREIEDQIRLVLHEMGEDGHKPFLVQACEIKRQLMLEALAPKPEAVEVLRSIHERGLKLALATDCSWDTVALLDANPMRSFFEVVASSAHIRVRKPHERIYRHVLDGLGVQGAGCLYVGDGHSNELIGAKRHEMRTVWVNNGSDPYFKFNGLPEGDHTVRDLREILALIE